jgi:hypothetical protein
MPHSANLAGVFTLIPETPRTMASIFVALKFTILSEVQMLIIAEKGILGPGEKG